ncbi:carboxymuconolactone decarboxylase family protein [Actinacidiphila sp. bgisy145]|uniref:carboxymuconolactone decarboxylase family protein n=1 Tax=Actinacidiphila sp. bgisy145 TaxID=3413792 RepID=UPI003EC00F01
MEARMDLTGNALMNKVIPHLATAGRLTMTSSIPAATLELVRLRASQINGCAFCTDMHTKEAAHAGESAIRLNLVAVWREATVFTDAERAALELTERATRVADGAEGVSDEVWAAVTKHYDEDQIAALLTTIALINAFNRLNIMIRQPAGSYVVGQLG